MFVTVLAFRRLGSFGFFLLASLAFGPPLSSSNHNPPPTVRMCDRTGVTQVSDEDVFPSITTASNCSLTETGIAVPEIEHRLTNLSVKLRLHACTEERKSKIYLKECARTSEIFSLFWSFMISIEK